MRDLKRKKNAPKELAKLKKVLDNDGRLDADMMEGVKGKNIIIFKKKGFHV